MRVFISSTVYDLIDVRAELAEQLRSLGITPVLSDDKLSDFRVQYDVNSIETCLVNVDSCDEVILILDRRYSATLEAFGYGEISATHLEYRRAVEKKIPVRVYVRDRLEADFSIWKRNGRSDSVKLSWITEEKDKRLFKLLDERSQLEADATTSNWYSTFTNSIDLKAAITKHFEKRILPERLTQAIQSNNFPLIDIKVQASETGNYHSVVFDITLSNIGNSPAFNFYPYGKKEQNDVGKGGYTIFAPTQSISNHLVWVVGSNKNYEKFFIVEYESLIGISVCDRFLITCKIKGNALVIGGRLIDRKFQRSEGISIEIEDT